MDPTVFIEWCAEHPEAVAAAAKPLFNGIRNALKQTDNRRVYIQSLVDNCGYDLPGFPVDAFGTSGIRIKKRRTVPSLKAGDHCTMDTLKNRDGDVETGVFRVIECLGDSIRVEWYYTWEQVQHNYDEPLTMTAPPGRALFLSDHVDKLPLSDSIEPIDYPITRGYAADRYWIAGVFQFLPTKLILPLYTDIPTSDHADDYVNILLNRGIQSLKHAETMKDDLAASRTWKLKECAPYKSMCTACGMRRVIRYRGTLNDMDYAVGADCYKVMHLAHRMLHCDRSDGTALAGLLAEHKW